MEASPTVKQFAAALDAGMSTVAKHMEDLRKDAPMFADVVAA